jgi:UDP-glucuronate 4-epimerase
MKILVTGSAGFIGSALTIRLLERGDEVIGIDNHNNYYNQDLKEARLKRHLGHQNYTHIRADIADGETILNLFKTHQPQRVVNLAAQAGVRYSLENPQAYVESNLVGFSHILEGCRQNKVEHLVYASSSSVYGANTELPFSVHQNVDHPLSLYAATKKANELMAHVYSHLYNLPTTGLRFFTVYGPWDRPDMALQKFATTIVKGETLKVFNNGNHQRDFTYIDDITEGIIRVLDQPARSNSNWDSGKPDPATSTAPWRIYNIGNNRPINLLEYINLLELALGEKAKKEFLPIQPGDLPSTWANVDELVKEFNYEPSTTTEVGIIEFVKWFKSYYK